MHSFIHCILQALFAIALLDMEEDGAEMSQIFASLNLAGDPYRIWCEMMLDDNDKR